VICSNISSLPEEATEVIWAAQYNGVVTLFINTTSDEIYHDFLPFRKVRQLEQCSRDGD
jgi:hypothetical protein